MNEKRVNILLIMIIIVSIGFGFYIWDFRYTQGYEHGYEYGYALGNNTGYKIGYEEGYKTGDKAGYNKGYQVGYNDGEKYGKDIGYSMGYNAGFNKGNYTGFSKGYTYGYDIGFQLGLKTEVWNIRNPTYNEIIDFIYEDDTDKNPYIDDVYVCWNYAADVKSNAFKAGYRCFLVYLEFVTSAHAIVAFNTTDMGLVFIEPQDDSLVTVSIGHHYWDRDKYYVPYDDTIIKYVLIP